MKSVYLLMTFLFGISAVWMFLRLLTAEARETIQRTIGNLILVVASYAAWGVTIALVVETVVYATSEDLTVDWIQIPPWASAKSSWERQLMMGLLKRAMLGMVLLGNAILLGRLSDNLLERGRLSGEKSDSENSDPGSGDGERNEGTVPVVTSGGSPSSSASPAATPRVPGTAKQTAPTNPSRKRK